MDDYTIDILQQIRETEEWTKDDNYCERKPGSNDWTPMIGIQSESELNVAPISWSGQPEFQTPKEIQPS